MEIPAPLMSGTITYFVLTMLAVFAGMAMGVTGKMNKENASYVPRALLSLSLIRWILTITSCRSNVVAMTTRLTPLYALQNIHIADIHDGRLPVALLGVLLAAPVAHPRGADVPVRVTKALLAHTTGRGRG